MQEKPFKLKKEITLGTALSITVPLVVGLVVWGFTTSGALTNHSEDIKRIESTAKKNTDSIYTLQKDIQKEMKEDRKEMKEDIQRIVNLLLEKK